jgi:hypothetical protein
MFEDILGKVCQVAWERKNPGFLESFKPNQIRSKLWLVDNILKIQQNFKNVAVLGSWNSILLYELMKDNVENWHFHDKDSECHWDRQRYFEINNMSQNYTEFHGDVVSLFSKSSFVKQYDLIINPSCEHMDDIRSGPGPLYALTSNNYTTVKEHINTIEHEEDLAIKNNINDIRYKGTIQIEKPVPYERYCVVGYA